MPIYAYKCNTCGHSADVMQKMSDAVLTTCPACGAETYAKQLTAPGFALKGSGWYVTDFRGGKQGDSNGAKTADAPATTATPATPATANSATATTPAPAPTPAVPAASAG